MTKLEFRSPRHRHFNDGYGDNYFGGNFIDSIVTPESYPPQCRGCKQQCEGPYWREDVDKVLCDECYAKEKEHGQEES